MPIHAWTCVDAGIFHHFHHSWVSEVKRLFNQHLLPSNHYALVERLAPDRNSDESPVDVLPEGRATNPLLELAATPPHVRFRIKKAQDYYATKAKAVVIRHTSHHKVIAVVEIVSPGNKNTHHGIKAFVDKAQELLQAGIHLLILDLFPPGPRDPHGLHPLIWEGEEGFSFAAEKPLTMAAYNAAPAWEAFLEPVAVGDPMPEMPLFLTPEIYVPVPLEPTYQAAWEAVPTYWRQVLLHGSTSVVPPPTRTN